MTYMYNKIRPDSYYQEGHESVPQPEQPEPKKKKNNLSGFVALFLSVAVLGTGTGLLGSYIGNRYLTNDKSVTYDTTVPPSLLSQVGESENQSVTDKQTASTPSAGTSALKDENGEYYQVADLVDAVEYTVVEVENYQKSRTEETLAGSGSGIIISSDGYIITNNHVISNADLIKVIIRTSENEDDNKTYNATLIGTDKNTDIAVLKIDATNLLYAELGDSDTLRVGDTVIAIGNPSGLVGTVTKGIVSGLNRYYETDTGELSSIQTDAAVNFGNSGGAMFDMAGKVVGIVNAKIVSDGSDNLGFAITINEAKPIIEDLTSKGYVSGRPILGITLFYVNEYVGYAQGMEPGLYVTEINEELPVAESGLKVGDSIVSMDGTDVLTLDDVSAVLNTKKPGDTVKTTVLRSDTLGNRKYVDLEITISEYTGQ